MRAFLVTLCSLITFVQLYGQAKIPVKSQKTVFILSAVDDKTSALVPARFFIQAKQAKQQFTGESQVDKPFAFTLTRADTLTVIADSPGYYGAEELMAVSCDTCAEYAYSIRLEKEDLRADSIFQDLKVNQAFRLDNVYFDQSSYVLRPESYPQLNKLIKTLMTIPKLVIEIAGHTDNVGDKRLNQALSENRAKIITNYLITNGISENRLRHNGYGSTKPAAPNDTEENKRKNRRVEFVVLSL